VTGRIQWPVDAHVHLHTLERVPDTFDAAAANFGREFPGREGLIGCLLLTQTSWERVFEALVDRSKIGDWRLAPVPAEPESIIASRGSHALAVICGRQVRADNGLEVAALGTRQVFADGRSIATSLADVVASGAIAAFPWGFGKWTGSRGRLLESVLAKAPDGSVFIGDSGSRLWLLGEPSVIGRARARGLRVLAGTDPFPFAADHRRVGSFGFLAAIDPDAEAPWRALRAWLLGLPESPTLYGRPSGPCRFVLNQLGIQVFNRLRGSRTS
jgi:hypothetical protein